MTVFDVVVLGLVQGLTEFIPVSSSGHLVIAHQLFGMSTDFSFDVLLNIGTLSALLWYFRSRLSLLLRQMWHTKDFSLAGLLLMATVPTFIIGFVWNDFFEAQNGKLWLVIIDLSVVGLLMVLFGRPKMSAREDIDNVGPLDAATIGAAQVFALLPGMSRSGVTMLAGFRRGLSARLSAEFSFLLAIPTISGAVAHTLLSSEGRQFITEQPVLFAIGNLVSFTAGIWAVAFLLKLLAHRGLRDFGFYRLALSALLTVLLLTNVIS